MRKKFYHLNKVTLGAFSSQASGSHCFLLSVSALKRSRMHLKRKYFFFFYFVFIFVHLGRSCFFWSQRRCHSRGVGQDPLTPSWQRLHLTLNFSHSKKGSRPFWSFIASKIDEISPQFKGKRKCYPMVGITKVPPSCPPNRPLLWTKFQLFPEKNRNGRLPWELNIS